MEIQVNQSRVRPYGRGGIEQAANLSAVIVYADSTPVVNTESSEQDAEDQFLQLLTPLGPLTPDPKLERTSVADETVNSNDPEQNSDEVKALNASLDNLHYQDRIVRLNDNEFQDFYGVFSSLSIQQFQEYNDTISKIHQNFSGKWNVFFMGQKPRLFVYSGVILDYADFPHYQQFAMGYDRYLSGRASVEQALKTKILYDNKLASAYLLSFSVTGEASSENLKRFSMTALVYDVEWIRINTHKSNDGVQTGRNLLSNKGDLEAPADDATWALNYEGNENPGLA